MTTQLTLSSMPRCCAAPPCTAGVAVISGCRKCVCNSVVNTVCNSLQLETESGNYIYSLIFITLIYYSRQCIKICVKELWILSEAHCNSKQRVEIKYRVNRVMTRLVDIFIILLFIIIYYYFCQTSIYTYLVINYNLLL